MYIYIDIYLPVYCTVSISFSCMLSHGHQKQDVVNLLLYRGIITERAITGPEVMSGSVKHTFLGTFLLRRRKQPTELSGTSVRRSVLSNSLYGSLLYEVQ